MANHKSSVWAVEARLQQHELAVAGDDKVLDLLIRVASREPLPHQQAEVLGERRFGIVDRLVLADETAQAFGDVPRPRLERRIWQHLVRLDGLGRKRGEVDRHREQRPQEERAEVGAAALRRLSSIYFAAARPWPTALARFGAPTLRRRSDRDKAPPMNITTAPSQMNRTSGWK